MKSRESIIAERVKIDKDKFANLKFDISELMEKWMLITNVLAGLQGEACEYTLVQKDYKKLRSSWIIYKPTGNIHWPNNITASSITLEYDTSMILLTLDERNLNKEIDKDILQMFHWEDKGRYFGPGLRKIEFVIDRVNDMPILLDLI